MSDNRDRKIVIRPEDLADESTPRPRTSAPAQPASAPSPTYAATSSQRRVVLVTAAVLGGIALLVALAIVWVVTREDSKGNGAQKRAIQRVGAIDKRLTAETIQGVPANARPSQLVRAIDEFCKRALMQDFTDCPADFVVAYKQHVRAWTDVREAVAQLPEDVLEGLFMGFFNAILRAEADGGERRMKTEVVEAERRVRTRWEEVERIAANYGVVID